MTFFSRKKPNQKWETIYKRERRIDIISGILLLPMMYILTVLVFCL